MVSQLYAFSHAERPDEESFLSLVLSQSISSMRRANLAGSTTVYPSSFTLASQISPPPVQSTISLALPTGTVKNGRPAAQASNKTKGEYSILEAKTNKLELK